jgi:hypothetical protein
MRPRSSLALAGALLMTLLPGTAMATPDPPSGTTVAVATDAASLGDGGIAGDPADSSDTPDTGMLVPQDGAVLDDVGDQLSWPPRSELLAGILHLRPELEHRLGVHRADARLGDAQDLPDLGQGEALDLPSLWPGATSSAVPVFVLRPTALGRLVAGLPSSAQARGCACS